jgi:hypothetical protein
MEIDPKLLEELKREAKKSNKPYQSLIGTILQHLIKKNAA